jgi:uncharacterized protein (TIGR03086 family)
MSGMTHFDDFQQKADRFTAIVDGASPGRWPDMSPCEGWSAADLVDHVVESQRSFLDRQQIDLGPRPGGDPATVWHAHLSAMLQAVADVADREYDGYFGRTTIGDTLANFYGFDLVVHRWDLARATGQDSAFSEDEMDYLEQAIAGFGDQLYAEGVCKPAVPAPEEATRQERLLATMGRDPRRVVSGSSRHGATTR